jgi:predicted metal-dependent phosphoesterase TrpH
MIKIDFHVHTTYSGHSLLTLERLKKLEQKTKVIPIITDHAIIYANKKYKCLICGEEITTKQGDILAYFINEKIPNHLDIYETIDMIREQDGLVAVPHPFDRIRKREMPMYINKIDSDMIEVFNGFASFNKDNKKAHDFAVKMKKLKIVGSDSHTPFGYGRTYVEMEEFGHDNKKEFLKNLKSAKLVTQKLPISAFLSVPAMHFRGLYLKYLNMFSSKK